VPRCGVCAESGPPTGRFPEKPPVGRASGGGAGGAAGDVRCPIEDTGAPEREVADVGCTDPEGDEPGVNR